MCAGLGVPRIQSMIDASMPFLVPTSRKPMILDGVNRIPVIHQGKTSMCTGCSISHAIALMGFAIPSPVELFLRGKAFVAAPMQGGSHFAAYRHLVGSDTIPEFDDYEGPDFVRKVYLKQCGFLLFDHFPSIEAFEQYTNARKAGGVPADELYGPKGDFNSTVRHFFEFCQQRGLYAPTAPQLTKLRFDPLNADGIIPPNTDCYVPESNTFVGIVLDTCNIDLFRAILQKVPLILGANTNQGWATVTKANDVIHAGGTKGGGHAVCVIGYDDQRQMLRILNSWGSSWGNNGQAWLTYDFVRQNFLQAFVLLPNPENCAYGWETDDESSYREMLFDLLKSCPTRVVETQL